MFAVVFSVARWLLLCHSNNMTPCKSHNLLEPQISQLWNEGTGRKNLLFLHMFSLQKTPCPEPAQGYGECLGRWKCWGVRISNCPLALANAFHSPCRKLRAESSARRAPLQGGGWAQPRQWAARSDSARQAFQDVTFPGALPPSFLRLWMASWVRDTAKEYPAVGGRKGSFLNYKWLNETNHQTLQPRCWRSHLQRRYKIQPLAAVTPEVFCLSILCDLRFAVWLCFLITRQAWATSVLLFSVSCFKGKVFQ